MRTFHKTQKAVACKGEAGRGGKEEILEVVCLPHLFGDPVATASLGKGWADTRCEMVRPTHMLNLPSSQSPQNDHSGDRNVEGKL